jgi:hypothetical protein
MKYSRECESSRAWTRYLEGEKDVQAFSLLGAVGTTGVEKNVWVKYGV